MVDNNAFVFRLTKAAYDEIEKHEKTGLDYEDSWNQASVQLVRASEVVLNKTNRIIIQFECQNNLIVVFSSIRYLLLCPQAHCRVIICEKSWLEAQRLTKSLSPALSKVLLELVQLYIIYWALEKKGDFLVVSLKVYLKLSWRATSLTGYTT